jgi:hypothetical protein
MTAGVMRWEGRVLAADDVRRRLNGHRAVLVPAHTVVTPLAAEELRDRDVSLTYEDVTHTPANTGWGLTGERPYAAVEAAVRSLAREGVRLKSLPGCDGPACDWAAALARCVAAGECCGGVVFCADPGLVACVANKLAGVRAAAVSTVAHAARAALALGANVLAVEMPGRTFFEVRQVLRLACACGNPTCPPAVAGTLGKVEADAHR